MIKTISNFKLKFKFPLKSQGCEYAFRFIKFRQTLLFEFN